MGVTYTTASTGSVQTASDFATPEIKTFYEMELLDRALPELYHCSFTKAGRIPERAGGTIEWRKAKALPVATTPIVEGVTPESTAGDWGYVTATPNWYGSYIRHSDVLQLTAIDDVVLEDSQRLGEQAGDTADQLTRDLMVASGTEQVVGQSLITDITANDTLTADALLQAWATLKAQGARGFDFIGNRLAVILHSFAWKDLMRDPEFRNAIQEAGVRSDDHPLFTGDVWDFMNMRFFITSNAKVGVDAGSSTVDVYYTLVIARDAIGISGIGSAWFDMQLGMGGTGNRIMPVELIAKQVDSGGVENALNQRGSIGWKASQEEVELDANWLVRIEHACSMGAN
ncbi:MAG: N4-gp56 family major capsid protein [Anaerolineae bacterium]|nr:N4-gp56 family major capsid protein [Anaerolineae bacterium]NIO00438.1 N4-gp56 family major capsid protein [Anaerolineae bacterium]NIQ83198.1 N4-gp56 family major capsid protein [Anaerolineae bacterium]